MGKVGYNQSGYCGSSMSVRAQEAYEDGEAPRSKWTKQAMLMVLEDEAEEQGVGMEGVEKMTKAEIFDTFFEWKSWHHTSKFANETDFYGLDINAVWDNLATDRQKAAREAEEEYLRKLEEEREVERHEQLHRENVQRCRETIGEMPQWAKASHEKYVGAFPTDEDLEENGHDVFELKKVSMADKIAAEGLETEDIWNERVQKTAHVCHMRDGYDRWWYGEDWTDCMENWDA